MYFYYFVIFFVYLLYVISNILGKNRNKLFVISAFLFLIIISGIRGYNVGGDLQHYLRNYPILGQQSIYEILTDRIKYGYVFSFLCKIAYFIDTSNTSFLIVTSMFSLIPIGYFVYKFSPIPILSVYIYITFSLYTNTFNSVRASMALGIIVFSLRYIVERKFWKFLLVFLLAFEIHQTVIFILLLYPMYKIRLNLKFILQGVGICFIVAQASSQVVPLIREIAFFYDPGSYSEIDEELSGGYNLLVFLLGITIGMYFLHKRDLSLYNNCTSLLTSKVHEKEQKSNGYVQLFMMSLVLACCQLCFATLYTELTRICIFTYFAIIVLIPISIRKIKNITIRKTLIVITIVFFFVFFNTHVMKQLPAYDNSNDQRTLPYKTFWEK